MASIRKLQESAQIYNKITEAENAKKSSLKKCRITASRKPWDVSSTSNHAPSQAYIRFPHKTSLEWEDFHRKAIRSIEKDNPVDGVHVIHSKSHGHGVVAAIDNKRREYKIITVLDKNQKHATNPSDIKHVCESSEIQMMILNKNGEIYCE